MIAGIMDFWVMAEVIEVRAIEEITATLLNIPNPLIVFVLKLDE